MTITFIGHGYVGLVSACVFADFGNKVWVIGHTGEKIERLKKGDPIIYEPGLKELLENNLTANRIFFTLEYETAIAESDIVFIAVNANTTPNGFDDSNIRSGLSLVGEGKVVVIKSTLLPGMTKTTQKDFPLITVLFSPEFLSEVTAAHDAANPFSNIVGSSCRYLCTGDTS